MAVTAVLLLQHWVRYCCGMSWTALNKHQSANVGILMSNRAVVLSQALCKRQCTLCLGMEKNWHERRCFTTCWKTQCVLKQWKGFYHELTLVLGSICPLVALPDPKIWWSDLPCRFPSEHACSQGRKRPGRSRMFKDEERGVPSRPFLAALLPHHLIFFAILGEQHGVHFTCAL